MQPYIVHRIEFVYTHTYTFLHMVNKHKLLHFPNWRAHLLGRDGGREGTREHR